LINDDGNLILFESYKPEFKFDSESLKLIKKGKNHLIVEAL